MDDSLSQQIQKRIGELPEDVQAAIASADFEKKIHAIGTKHQLHIDQLERLGDETMLVMLAFTRTEDFAANIAEHVGVTAEQAGSIVSEINNEILSPIRESLKKFSAQVGSVPATPPPAAPAATPKPQVPLAPHPHDLMLIEKTVTTPAAPTKTAAPPPPKPENYKADPYREPVEP